MTTSLPPELPRGTINVNIHLAGLGEVLQITNLLHKILNQGQQIMAIADDIRSLITQLDTKTSEIGQHITEVADRIQRILDQLSGGLSAAEAETVRAQLSTEVDTLTAEASALEQMGKDPANPFKAKK